MVIQFNLRKHPKADAFGGKTRIISNQFGYPHETAKAGKHEFDPRGCLVKIGQQD